MTDLVEAPAEWVAGIYQLETNDPVMGGAEGIDNLQAKQLAKRTAYLKAQVEAAQGGLTAHEAAADPHPQYMTTAETEALVEARVGDYSLDTGTANAKVVALNPAIAAYTGNFSGAFKNAVANTNTVTVDFGAGAVPLVNDAGAALVPGDLPAGHVVGYQYIHADGKAYITSLVKSQTVGTVIISEDSTNIAGSTSLDTYTDTANSLSVTPGRWIIQWGGRISIVSSGGTGFCLPELTLTDAANTIIKKAKGINVLAGQSAYGSPVDSYAVVDVAIDTTYKLRFCASSYSGAPILGTVDTNGGATKTTLMGTKL